MKTLRLTDFSASPLSRERELLRQLQGKTACNTERVRLVIEGHRLCLDGFVGSVHEKFEVERTCRALAPESILVNRLRVAC